MSWGKSADPADQPHGLQLEALRRLETVEIRSRRPVRLVEFAAALTSLLLFGGTIFRVGLDQPGWVLVLILWQTLMATGAIALAVLQDRRTSRRTRYASALESVHLALHKLRDAEAAILLRDAPQAETVPLLAEFLTSAATAFTVVTGHRCRTCIKQVHYPEGEAMPIKDMADLGRLSVSTMCRDNATANQAHDSEAAEVDQNTDFEDLFLKRETKAWFMSNDLRERDTYKNSSPSWRRGEPDYLATCVWPIQKQDETNTRRHDTLAFLCVDSMETHIFHRHFDFEMGAALADALYPMLKLMHRQEPGARFASLASAVDLRTPPDPEPSPAASEQPS